MRSSVPLPPLYAPLLHLTASIDRSVTAALQAAMATENQDANDLKSPKEAAASKVSKDSSEADAKEGLTETKESKPKGSGRADCLCSLCHRMLPLSEFSGSQKKKKRNARKCLTCALLPVVPGSSGPRTPRTRKKAEPGECTAAAAVACVICNVT